MSTGVGARLFVFTHLRGEAGEISWDDRIRTHPDNISTPACERQNFYGLNLSTGPHTLGRSSHHDIYRAAGIAGGGGQLSHPQKC